jgi:hypothetical protein
VIYPLPRPRVVLAIFAALAIGSSLVDVAMTAVGGGSTPPGLAVVRNGFVWLLFGALSFLAIFAARRFPSNAAGLHEGFCCERQAELKETSRGR